MSAAADCKRHTEISNTHPMINDELHHFGENCSGVTPKEQTARLAHCFTRNPEQFAFLILVLAHDPGKTERLNGVLVWTRARWLECFGNGMGPLLTVYCLDYRARDEFDFAMSVLSDKSIYRAFTLSGDSRDSDMGRRFYEWSRRVGRLMTAFPRSRAPRELEQHDDLNWSGTTSASDDVESLGGDEPIVVSKSATTTLRIERTPTPPRDRRRRKRWTCVIQ